MHSILCVLCCISLVSAYHNGAGLGACGDLTPQHGATAQTTNPPYNLTVTGKQYTGSGTMDVTVTGVNGAKFVGFLIGAYLAGDKSLQPIGTFSARGSTPGNHVQDRCDGANGDHGATHTDTFHAANGNKLELTWNAPSSVVGNIIFRLTVVESRAIFWVNIESEEIWDGVSDKPTTPPPAEGSSGPSIAGISTAECGKTKSCRGKCENNKCEYLLTWQTDGAKTKFELLAGGIDSTGYAALGLAKTNSMKDVSIIACQANAKVTQHYASGRATPDLLSVGPIDSEPTEASYDAATETVSCRFTYDNNVAKTDLAKWKDLDTDLYAFIARSTISFNEKLNKHLTLPDILPETNYLASGKAGAFASNLASVSVVNVLVKAHGAIMVFAWVFCASIGLILARYYKPMWTNQKACGQKVWFSYHRALMLTCMFLTIIAFILILVETNGIFDVTSMTLPWKAHPIIGLIAIICSLLNPLIAAFRCHPGDRMRPVFNWIHWFFGTVAHIFAVVAIFLGMLFEKAQVPGWLVYVMMAWCLCHVLCEFILEIHQCCMYDKNRDRSEEFQMTQKGDPQAVEPKYAGRKFKCGMLAIYLIITSILTVVIIAIIAAWK